MNKQTREALDTYYKDAASWAGDRERELAKSRKTAWTVAGCAAGLALLEALALVLLTPLKTTETVTLLVDRNTGFVQAVRPLDPQRVSADTALTQSLLVQYVVQRESYDADAVQANYRNVTLWSAENARADYIAAMQGSNPQSPLVRYGRSGVVETQVRSVSPVARNVAMVRFETRLKGANGTTTPLGAWVAMIRYRFSGEPMRQEDRYANPLGFQVVRYRRDQEALPQPETAPQPQAAQGLTAPQAAQPPATMVIPNVQRQPAPQPAQPRQTPQRPAEPEPEL